MMRSRIDRLTACGIVALAAMTASSAAAQTQGTIDVSLTVTNACVVNGAAAVQADAGGLGQISFSTQPGIFDDVDAEMVATGSAGALAVLCSPGASPSLTVGSGNNDLSNQRRLASADTAIPYRLFSDAARTSEIAIGQQLALPTATTSATLVPIYARVNSGGVVLPAGTYTDTVQVTLSW